MRLRMALGQTYYEFNKGFRVAGGKMAIVWLIRRSSQDTCIVYYIFMFHQDEKVWNEHLSHSSTVFFLLLNSTPWFRIKHPNEYNAVKIKKIY